MSDYILAVRDDGDDLATEVYLDGTNEADVLDKALSGGGAYDEAETIARFETKETCRTTGGCGFRPDLPVIDAVIDTAVELTDRTAILLRDDGLEPADADSVYVWLEDETGDGDRYVLRAVVNPHDVERLAAEIAAQP